jgi:uncharacterized protein YndB with AHSA1/START domain
MKYTCEITIDRPRARVIELFDNPENLKQWQPELVSFEHVSVPRLHEDHRVLHGWHVQEANGEVPATVQGVRGIATIDMERAEANPLRPVLSDVFTSYFASTFSNFTR